MCECVQCVSVHVCAQVYACVCHVCVLQCACVRVCMCVYTRACVGDTNLSMHVEYALDVFHPVPLTSKSQGLT